MFRIYVISFCLALTLQVSADDVSFGRDVAPILVQRCLGCHNNRISEGRYALDTLERLLRAGDSEEPIIVAGQPDQSYLFQRINDSDADLRMPQEDAALNAHQIQLIRSWIEQGAKFGDADPQSRLTSLLPARQHPAPPETYRLPIPVFALEFSPDGQYLISGGWHELLVREVSSGRLVNRIPDMPQRIQSVVFSPDSQMLAVCGGAPGDYGEVRLLSIQAIDEQDGVQTVQTISGWDDLVLDICFSPDGERVISCGADYSVRCCQASNGAEIWRTSQHVDWVTSVDVTDYRFAESYVPNDSDNSLFEWNEDERSGGQHVRQYWEFGSGHYIIREANWELESRPAGRLDVSGKNTESASVTSVAGDRSVLTRITVSGIGRTYHVKRDSIAEEELEGHSAVINYLTDLAGTWGAASPGSRFVVSSSRDRTAKVFSLKDGSLFTTYKGHRREYGPLKGLHRVFDVHAESGTRRIWSGGEGQHFHGWNAVTVRDEDGTAADMEERFSKEYSTDLIRHEFADAVFSFARLGNILVAGAAGGHVRGYVAFGDDAAFDVNAVAPSTNYANGTDHIFVVATSAAVGRVATASVRAEVVVREADGREVSRFVAVPLDPRIP